MDTVSRYFSFVDLLPVLTFTNHIKCNVVSFTVNGITILLNICLCTTIINKDFEYNAS